MPYFGVKSGMMFSEYVAFLFDLNSQTKRKLSDEELIIKIIREYPYRKELLTKLTPRKLREYRALYNAGLLNRHYHAPIIPSFRYIKGVIVSCHNRPLAPAQIKLRLATQYKRWKKARARLIQQEIAKPEPKKPAKKHKVRKTSILKRMRIGKKKAFKAYSQRLWLQKQIAKLQGTSPWG